MTLAQTERLLKLLRANGVSYYKSEDLEIKMEAVESPTSNADSVVPVSPEVPRGTRPVASEPSVNHATKQDNAGDIKVKVAEVPHKINEMVSILQMDNETLIDKLFPEGAQPPFPGGV